MIAATGNPAVKAGFDRRSPASSTSSPTTSTPSQKPSINETAAIMMEPVQGEGGVNLFSSDYHRQRSASSAIERGLTLIFDEVWTGCGRTGRWFAHQHFRR
jgi:acetylornithine/N-succinyldiaminopimelate aminotransferase